jgi:hypothetical protein
MCMFLARLFQKLVILGICRCATKCLVHRPICTVSEFQNEFKVETKILVFAFSLKFLAIIYENDENLENLSPTFETYGIFLQKYLVTGDFSRFLQKNSNCDRQEEITR